MSSTLMVSQMSPLDGEARLYSAMTAGSPSLGTRASLKDGRFMARGFGKAPRGLERPQVFYFLFLDGFEAVKH